MSELQVAIVPVTPFQQNCAIVWDKHTGIGAVIDPGGDVARIIEALDKLGVRAEKILLTHGHIDHAGGAAELREVLTARAGGTAVPIEGPDQRDLFLLRDLAEQGRALGMVGSRDVQPDRWLTEGDTVTIGGQAFAVLHCPGHTPGHVVFHNAPAHFAIVGDVLFRGSVGRTDFHYGDARGLVASIRSKLFPLGDEVAFICGHGPASSIGVERRENPFVGQGAAPV